MIGKLGVPNFYRFDPMAMFVFNKKKTFLFYYLLISTNPSHHFLAVHETGVDFINCFVLKAELACPH